MNQKEKLEKKITAFVMFTGMVLIILLFKAYLKGKFDSVETMQLYVAGFGILAPVILVFIQAMQVILPVLPGFFGCIVGTALFGWKVGFWLNYIGISAGSIIAFLLAKKYGQPLVRKLFPGEKYKKISDWATGSRFYTLILFAGMVLPLFPDDYFCYLTGLTEMKTRKFSAIIIFGKPWCILAYCMAFGAVLK